MEKNLVCSSCHKNLQKGATIFMCPNCGKEEIMRCRSCKELGVRYACKSCGFSGPG